MNKNTSAIIVASLLGVAASQASHTIGYQFESGSGPVPNTESATMFSGTLNNGATIGSPNISPISPGSNSLILDGTDDFMAINGGGTLLNGASGFSMTTYFTLGALPASGFADLAFFARGGPGASSTTARLAFAVGSDGQLRIGGRRDDADGSFARHVSDDTGLFTVGETYGVGTTLDFSGGGAPTVKLFVDGMLIASGPDPGFEFSAGTAFSATDGFEASIGGRGDGEEAFNGIIDDVKIWDSAIPDAVAMANTVPEPSSALLFGTAGVIMLGFRRRNVA